MEKKISLAVKVDAIMYSPEIRAPDQCYHEMEYSRVFSK